MLFINQRFVFARYILMFVLLTGWLGVVQVDGVWAATIIVSNTNDSGPGSLREAIALAVAGDVITFDQALAGQTITLASNLSITKNLVIDGSGLIPQPTISGGDAFHLETTNSSDVTITDLTISNGYTAGNGGAVYSKKAL